MKAPAPRLGRGLASLLGETAISAPANGIISLVALDLLEPNPFQPRGPVQPEDLTELAASIRTQGVLQPILARPHPARPGHYQIIAGERRWRAAQMAGLAEIPCFTRTMPDVDASAAALIENLQRRDLNPIEEAEGFQRLIDNFGLTHEELGAAIGKSRSHVANLVRLLSLPNPVKDNVRNGSLSAGHARAALACPDPVAAAQTMISKGLNVRQAEALAGASASSNAAERKSRQPERGNADLRAVEADLTEQLGLQVAISFNGRGGTISLRYQNLDQLDHIVVRLSNRITPATH